MQDKWLGFGKKIESQNAGKNIRKKYWSWIATTKATQKEKEIFIGMK